MQLKNIKLTLQLVTNKKQINTMTEQQRMMADEARRRALEKAKGQMLNRKQLQHLLDQTMMQVALEHGVIPETDFEKLKRLDLLHESDIEKWRAGLHQEQEQEG